jgi:hypothetical protein
VKHAIIIALLVAAYVIGARYPGIAQRIGAA